MDICAHPFHLNDPGTAGESRCWHGKKLALHWPLSSNIPLLEQSQSSAYKTNIRPKCFASLLLRRCVFQLAPAMLTFLRTIALLVTLHTATASADYAPFVTFSNGQIAANETCTHEEMDIISGKVKKAVLHEKGRRLRSTKLQKKRALQLLKCFPLMAWATGKCGGATYTRRLGAEETKEGGGQEQHQTDACSAKTVKFNAELDLAATKISSECAAFLDTRTFECRQVLDCDIATFHTWNAYNDTIFQSDFPVSGATTNTLCSRINWAFQADTNFDVGTVQFTLTGPDGYSFSRTDYKAPYFLYGSKGTDRLGNRHYFNGAMLHVGTYTLTAVALASPESPHTAQFNIVDCD
jgi:hypothetical protein